MGYFWIALRGFAFWLGAFYAFTLAWAPLELSILPAVWSRPIMLAPVGALVFGAVVPSKALLGSTQMRVLLCIVLTIGVVGCVITAMDDLVQQNLVGLWFRIPALIMIGSLYFRVIFPRRLSASRDDPSKGDAQNQPPAR